LLFGGGRVAALRIVGDVVAVRFAVARIGIRLLRL
jgi:hypothetical protein